MKKYDKIGVIKIVGYLVLGLSLLVVGLGVKRNLSHKSEPPIILKEDYPPVSLPKTTKIKNVDFKSIHQIPDVPSKVYQVLEFVSMNRIAPEGYVGGRTFFNREKKLKLTTTNGDKIYYLEWDVNPKKEGVNRGAERLITGSDESAYYTNNHYNSFIKIK